MKNPSHGPDRGEGPYRPSGDKRLEDVVSLVIVQVSVFGGRNNEARDGMLKPEHWTLKSVCPITALASSLHQEGGGFRGWHGKRHKSYLKRETSS